MEEKNGKMAMMGQKKKKLNISRTIILDQLGKRRFLIETTRDESLEYGPTQEKKGYPTP